MQLETHYSKDITCNLVRNSIKVPAYLYTATHRSVNDGERGWLSDREPEPERWRWAPRWLWDMVGG